LASPAQLISAVVGRQERNKHEPAFVPARRDYGGQAQIDADVLFSFAAIYVHISVMTA